MYNNGTSLWDDKKGQEGSLDTTLTYSEGDLIVAGAVYKFRVRARNVYGFGAYSEEFSVMASTIPAKVTGVSTEIVNTDVKISWTKPSDNWEPLTSYTITI